jgi:hypothetical protein
VVYLIAAFHVQGDMRPPCPCCPWKITLSHSVFSSGGPNIWRGDCASVLVARGPPNPVYTRTFQP